MPYSQKEKKAEYNRKWYQKNKEERREYDKKYRELNKEKKRDQNIKWREENKEKIRERRKEGDKKYRELNNEKIREHKRERNKERRAHCIEYLGGKCVKCGATERLEFDHIKREGKKYSIARKLSYKFDNLKEELDKCQLLCYDCHKIKTKSEWTK